MPARFSISFCKFFQRILPCYQLQSLSIHDFSIHEEQENSNETDIEDNKNGTRKEPKVNITGSWVSSFLSPGNDFNDTLFVERSDFTYDEEEGYQTTYNISEFPRELDERLGPTALKVITG